MAQCFKCGITGDRVKLYDVISNEGIVTICAECNFQEELPLIKRPTSSQLAEAEMGRGSIYNRLSKAAGLNPEEHKMRIYHPERITKKGSDVTLKDIVDMKYKSSKTIDVPEKKSVQPRLRVETPKNMVDNFHWVMMMARRARKITQEQLAKEIAESVAAVKMLEGGIVPSDSDRLISKVESYLKISIIKKPAVPEKKEIVSDEMLDRGESFPFYTEDIPKKKKGFFGRIFGGSDKMKNRGEIPEDSANLLVSDDILLDDEE